MPRLRTASLVVVLGLVATLVGAPPAPARAPQVSGAPITLTAEPKEMVQGPDGNMWAVVSGTTDDLVRITPAGVVTYFDVVPGQLGALAVAAGDLWSVTGSGLVRIPLSDPTTPTVTANASIADPRGIALGPDGFLYAASVDKLVRWAPADPGSAITFTIAGMGAREVTATSDRIWIADFGGARLVAFKPGVTLDFTTITTGGNPQGVVAGPGDQVLYTNPGTNPQTIGRVKLGGTPQITEVPLADPSSTIAVGADGAYWVGLFNEQTMLRVTPQGQTQRLFSFPAPYRPRHVARGPGGTIWVSLQDPGNPGAIAKITGVVGDKAVSVKVAGRAPVKLRRARVRLTCPASEASGPCRGRVVLRSTARGHRVLGRSGWSAAAGRTVVAEVGLSRRLAASVPRRGLVVRASVTVRDGAGNSRTVTRRIRLVRST